MTSNEKTNEENVPKIFLSYAREDYLVASRIAENLRKRGINVWFEDFELDYGKTLVERIVNTISASDYIIILLSKNFVKSEWSFFELHAAMARELAKRDVTLLPVIIEDCKIPNLLTSYLFYDISSDFDKGINQLVEKISFIPSIDFSKLNESSFISLIIDLFQSIGFTDIERECRIADMIIDIKANYPKKGPFGEDILETWIVEVKFYRDNRADLRSIRQIASYLLMLPAHYKGLLVTNGQITSTARKWLDSFQKNNRIEIRVLEGTDLKHLILRNSKLVSKYLTNTRNHDE